MDNDVYVAINQLSRDRIETLRGSFLEELSKLDEEISSKIESAREDMILGELKKINGRLDAIESRLPEEEAQ